MVSYWDGTDFEPMVDLIDETAVSGVTLAQSGYMTWTTNKNQGWAKEDTVDTDGSEQITGMGSATVYDMYCLKITFSASLSATTALNWVGPKFCEDADLEGEHPLFGRSTFKPNYESGKTSWEKEIILASRLIVKDIIKKQSITSGDQLLERRWLLDACVSKCAEIIYNSLGDDYTDDRDNARLEYKHRVSLPNYKADLNKNARLEASEKGVRTGGIYR